MKLKCQTTAIKELQQLASRDRHSVLLEGVSGSGKTYLSKQYASMLGIDDYVNTPSTVSDIRKAIDHCYELESKVVICIENLDEGVLGASYTLLKFLEEPRDNIYIVVTCCNIHKVPDTIISRSSVVTLAAPTPNDIDTFISSYMEDRREIIETRDDIRKSVKNFHDVDYCMNMTNLSYCEHLQNLVSLIQSKKPISDIVWALGHYADGSEVPIKFMLNYIISNTSNSHIKTHGISCMKELDGSRIATHAVLSKFVMDCKYGE